jgi:hypothetical protein
MGDADLATHGPLLAQVAGSRLSGTNPASARGRKTIVGIDSTICRVAASFARSAADICTSV